jgi:hypothetical protein
MTKIEELIELADNAIHELDLFLGPDTIEKQIWQYCDADRRPEGEGPTVEELKNSIQIHRHML